MSKITYVFMLLCTLALTTIHYVNRLMNIYHSMKKRIHSPLSILIKNLVMKRCWFSFSLGELCHQLCSFEY